MPVPVHVIAAVTEKPSARRVLVHLGLPTEAPVLARARDPTVEVDDEVEPRGHP